MEAKGASARAAAAQRDKCSDCLPAALLPNRTTVRPGRNNQLFADSNDRLPATIGMTVAIAIIIFVCVIVAIPAAIVAGIIAVAPAIIAAVPVHISVTVAVTDIAEIKHNGLGLGRNSNQKGW